MHDQTDAQLLRDYAEHGAEAAFAEIVMRHTDLVYSAALRQVYSPDLARDVTQSVFTDLARKARTISANQSPEASLVGWLYRGTRFAARDLHRNETRRTQRESQAMEQLQPAPETPPGWEHLGPVLDDAMSELDDADRDAVLLRYFKNHDLRTVGATLGISDDAAQKRVSRAVEHLREIFAKRGVTVGAGELAVVISANAVQAAPAGMAVTISSAAALTGTITTATVATHTTMNWIIAKTVGTIVTAALVAGTGTYLVQQRESGRLRDENRTLIARQADLSAERAAATSEVTAISNQLQALKSNSQELLRLRGEIGMLRRQTQELEKLRQQNSELQHSLARAAQTTSDAKEAEKNPERLAGIAKLSDAKLLVLGLVMYANDHQDLLPTDMNQASNYWNNADVLLTGTNQFELVIQGSLNQSNIPNPSATIAVREREPSFLNGKWVKAYGFADGHAVIQNEPPEGFDAWEKARMISPAGK